MRFAPGLVLLSCLVATSCGAASSREAAEDTVAVHAPPIEAINEPATDEVDYLWSKPDDSGTGHTSDAQATVRIGTSWSLCFDDEPDEEADEPCEPSPEDIEKLRRSNEEFEQAIRPGKGSEARRIARLRLTSRRPKSQVFLIAWRNRGDKLCLADSEEDEEGGGSGGGVSGPCVPESHCGDICLSLSGTGSGQQSLYTTSGVVASKADALRITFDDGQVVTYELTGPLVPGFPEYRVFMLDLGRGIEARLELLQKDGVIAEENRSRAEVEAMRCSEKTFPESFLAAGSEQEREKAWNACMKEADSN